MKLFLFSRNDVKDYQRNHKQKTHLQIAHGFFVIDLF